MLSEWLKDSTVIYTYFFVASVAMRKHFMICVDNRGYESSLEIRKLYEVLTDKVAAKHHQIRVIDESGEDYLYPSKFFAPVRLSNVTKVKLELTAA